MGRIIVDLGTSRTAIGFVDERHWNFVTIPAPKIESHDPIGKNRDFDLLGHLIQGIAEIKAPSLPEPHLLMSSRYVESGALVLPFSPFTTPLGSLPYGLQSVPNVAPGAPFSSVKENGDSAFKFLTAVMKLAGAYVEEGCGWVVGRSAGSIDTSTLGIPGGIESHNEAIAVIFALITLDIASLLENYQDKFLLLADLGGGFLDISLADNLKLARSRAPSTQVNLQREESTARIANYGGYPLGVDRIDLRFSEQKVAAPLPLIELIATAIGYHLADYFAQPEAKKSGVIALVGGGFARLGKNVEQQTAAALENVLSRGKTKVDLGDVKVIHIYQHDTKYLTLKGLARLAKLRFRDDSTLEDISARDPIHFFGTLLPEHTASPTWGATLDSLRRKKYGEVATTTDGQS